MLEVGKYHLFKVKRKSDLGFMLEADGNEVLMHFREAKKEYNIGEETKAFLYYDKKNRLCATNNEVYATILTPGLLKVVNVKEEGVYLDNNTIKDVLLSKDDLPYDRSLWPVVGSELFVILKAKAKNIVAKLINREEAKKYREGAYLEGEKTTAYLEAVNDGGYTFLTSNYNVIFVPFMMARGKHHLGEKLEVKVTKVTNNLLYGSLLLNKEKQLVNDEDIIIEYLKAHKNFMPFTAKSSSEAIELTFKISRKAFKRAYGKLYKERKINFDEKGTYLL